MSQKVTIPLLDLRPELEAHGQEYLDAIAAVLRSGQFILGPQVEAFEREVAAYLGVAHAVGVNSGTDALVLALRAMGIGPGDEVITSPFTFFATAEAIAMVGATPVFVDIDPRTFNIDPDLVAAAVTPRTKAILPVHLYGQAADMEPILELARRHGLKVVEDVAQAFGGEYRGRRLGSLGYAAALSFFPSKNLGGFGDGGMVVTDDPRVAERVRMLRAHGSRVKYQNEMLGYNSRLDELQAAVLRVKLRHVDRWNDERRACAHRYAQLLAEVGAATLPFEAPYGRHVYHQFTVRLPGGLRDPVRLRLAELGVATAVYYPVPLHQLPPFREGGAVVASPDQVLPHAERAAREVLSLPLWPAMDAELQARVAAALAEAVHDARGMG